MTKDQLIHFLATKKAKKNLLETEWGDLTAALGNLTAEEKNDIARTIATGGGQVVINRLQKIMSDNAMELAVTEATQALADDTLTLAELDSLL